MYNTILVPVDITEVELTRQAIPHVEQLAKLVDSHIHFVVVIPSSPYYSAFGFGYAAAVDKQDILKAANDALIKTAKEFNIPEDRATNHAVMGSPKEQILKLADIINADLIVIGSHRPSTRTYLLGSNAAAVVRHAKCSVLVVR